MKVKMFSDNEKQIIKDFRYKDYVIQSAWHKDTLYNLAVLINDGCCLVEVYDGVNTGYSVYDMVRNKGITVRNFESCSQNEKAVISNTSPDWQRINRIEKIPIEEPECRCAEVHITWIHLDGCPWKPWNDAQKIKN